MLVTGFDDRQGCGYVLRTGPHAAEPTPGTQPVRHNGVVVLATPELAAALRDALVRNPVAQLGWGGPVVPLTLDDATVLAWLRNTLGGVLTVAGGPPPDPRRRPAEAGRTSSRRRPAARGAHQPGPPRRTRRRVLDEVVALLGDGAVDGVDVLLVQVTQAVDEGRVRGTGACRSRPYQRTYWSIRFGIRCRSHRSRLPPLDASATAAAVGIPARAPACPTDSAAATFAARAAAPQPDARGEVGGQHAVEGVARAGGVAHGRRARRQVLDLPAGLDDQRALAAERHDHRRPRPCGQPDGPDPGRPGPASAASSPTFGVSSGPCRPGRGTSSPARPGSTGAGLSTHGTSDRGRHLHGHRDRLDRDLGAHQHAPGVGQRVDQRARTRSRSTRAFAPAPTAIWFSPAASTTISATPVATPSSTATAVDAHALGAQLVERPAPGVVVADRADERHRRPHPRRRDRGVRALAAAVLHDARPDDRLPGRAAGRRRPRGPRSPHRPRRPCRPCHPLRNPPTHRRTPTSARPGRPAERTRRSVHLTHLTPRSLHPPSAVLDRVPHQRRPVRHAQPAQHPLDVVLHRPRREHQPRRDLPRRQPVHHQPQDVALPGGQPRPARLRASARPPPGRPRPAPGSTPPPRGRAPEASASASDRGRRGSRPPRRARRRARRRPGPPPPRAGQGQYGVPGARAASSGTTASTASRSRPSPASTTCGRASPTSRGARRGSSARATSRTPGSSARSPPGRSSQPRPPPPSPARMSPRRPRSPSRRTPRPRTPVRHHCHVPRSSGSAVPVRAAPSRSRPRGGGRVNAAASCMRPPSSSTHPQRSHAV